MTFPSYSTLVPLRLDWILGPRQERKEGGGMIKILWLIVRGREGKNVENCRAMLLLGRRRDVEMCLRLTLVALGKRRAGHYKIITNPGERQQIQKSVALRVYGFLSGNPWHSNR